MDYTISSVLTVEELHTITSTRHRVVKWVDIYNYYKGKCVRKLYLLLADVHL